MSIFFLNLILEGPALHFLKLQYYPERRIWNLRERSNCSCFLMRDLTWTKILGKKKTVKSLKKKGR